MWPAYGQFVVFAVLLVLVPGPDFAVVTRNTLVGGRRRGVWTAIGVTSSNVVQGAAAAAGLSALIVRIQPLFDGLRWAGIVYLSYLGGQALLAAVRGRSRPADAREAAPGRAGLGGWRQGFASNITNPKVLVFYLAVLPQFLSADAGAAWTLVFAWTHALIGLPFLLALVASLHVARGVLLRPAVRRALDALTGTVLVGFGLRLATERS